MNDETVLLLGAVAYDPKVVTIWEGFKAYFARQGLRMDYVLYSNYERQVEALIDGHLHVAWNSPLAWVRARRLAAARGLEAQAVAMRDTDCDLTSVVVVREDGPIKAIQASTSWFTIIMCSSASTGTTSEVSAMPHGPS